MLDSYTSVLNIPLKIVWENRNDQSRFPAKFNISHSRSESFSPKARAYVKIISRHVVKKQNK